MTRPDSRSCFVRSNILCSYHYIIAYLPLSKIRNSASWSVLTGLWHLFSTSEQASNYFNDEVRCNKSSLLCTFPIVVPSHQLTESPSHWTWLWTSIYNICFLICFAVFDKFWNHLYYFYARHCGYDEARQMLPNGYAQNCPSKSQANSEFIWGINFYKIIVAWHGMMFFFHFVMTWTQQNWKQCQHQLNSRAYLQLWGKNSWISQYLWNYLSIW